MICVSIIIPVYNTEKYLKVCLDSIFSQSLEELEVICVNDGSVDNSLQILNEYSEIYKNMTVITQKNAGSGIARNTGIKLAKGEYLMFVDPDDYLASNDVIQVLYQTARMNDVTVCGGSLVVDKNGIWTDKFSSNRKQSKVEIDGFVYFKEYQYPYAHQRYIIKRDFLLEHNIFYPYYRRGQDVPFMANILNTAGKFYMMSKVVYVARSGHKIEHFTQQKADDFVNSLCDVLKIAIDSNLKKLFNCTVQEIHSFAVKEWYRLLSSNNTWDKITKVNELITKGNDIFKCSNASGYLMDETSYVKYLKSLSEEWNKTIETVERYQNVAIYGAGLFGKKVCNLLRNKGYMPKCYVVSNPEENEKTVEGIEVIGIDDLKNGREYLFILCAMDLEARQNMEKNLKFRGYYHLCCINTDMIYQAGFF